MRIVWTESAADDLASIVEHISEDSVEAARSVARAIFAGVLNLRQMPHVGRKRSADNSRELVFAPWPYVVLYEVSGDRIYVKAIRHTSRDWSR
ncbi:Plasmid stabilization system protein ParE [Bryocella elongata]|uniref:Plasmid stabilization system protein ParE n=1 Tax=Bryocella elongata TaxID=863522 RepID=A0A1H5X0W8_9BACT|nr:Plasmid stabilization system protein ParE [Bryocella elongata]